MKRNELVARLERSGCYLVRHGGLHDIYRNPVNGQVQSVPRHREINERLARKILRTLTEEHK